MDIPDDLITPKQAAKLLSVHAVTVYRWIHYGVLPAYRRGRSRFLVSKKDLDCIVQKFEPLKIVERVIHDDRIWIPIEPKPAKAKKGSAADN